MSIRSFVHKVGFFVGGTEGLRGEKLERNDASELRILSLIDHTHSAFPELFEDLIMGYGLADHPLIIAGRLEFVKMAWYADK